jgi:hypothetical protein
MREDHINSYKVVVGLGLALALLAGSGCAHQRYLEGLKGRMDARVRTLTYDEAITQFGPPTAVAQGDAVTVATWTQETKSATAIPAFGLMYMPQQSHGAAMQLVFGADRILHSWTYRQW